MDLKYNYNPEVRAAMELIQTRTGECKALLTRSLQAQGLTAKQIEYQILNDRCVKYLTATYERILTFAIPISIDIYLDADDEPEEQDEPEEKPENE